MTTDIPSDDVPLETLLAHRDWVRALARRLVSDPNAADDLEQETWRMALERPPRRGGSVRAWFAAVLRNAARAAARRRSRAHARESLVAEVAQRSGVAAQSPGDVVAEAELQHRLVGHLLALDEPYKRVLLARFFEGRSVSEIAAASGEPVETVRTRIKRGVALLKTRMRREIGEDRGAWCLLLTGARHPGGQSGGTAVPSRGERGSGDWDGLDAFASGGIAMGIAVKVGVAAAVVLAMLMLWRAGDAQHDVADDAVRRNETAEAPPNTTSRGARATADASPEARGVARAEAVVRRPPADASAIRGVVVRRDGTPVEDVLLEALLAPSRRPAPVWSVRRETTVADSARSDRDGAFVLSLRPGDVVFLRVSKEGFASFEESHRSAGEAVRIVLEPGVGLELEARDEAGAPIPDTALRIESPSQTDGDRIVVRWAETDASGVVRVGDLPGGAMLFVMPVGALRGVAQGVQLPKSGTARAVITLGELETIRGRVVDASSGEPIPGATVCGNPHAGYGAVAGASGEFVLTGRDVRSRGSREPLRVHASAVGYLPASAEVTGGRSGDIALRRGGTGRLGVILPDGRPAAGASVTAAAGDVGGAGGAGAGVEAHATADETGAALLRGLDMSVSQTLTVSAVGAGTVRRLVALTPDAAGEIDLGSIRLTSARRISGRTLAPDGSALRRGRVVLRGPALDEDDATGARPLPILDSTRSEDDGSFTFTDLSPGTYAVELTKLSGESITVPVVVPETIDVSGITLPPTPASDGVVVVTVTDEAGAAVQGVTVAAETTGGARPSAKTDSGGLATIAEPPGARVVRVVVEHPGGEPFLRADPADVVAGRARIVLRRGALLSYTLVHDDGRPLASAIVSIETEDGRPAPEAVALAVTDIRGHGLVVLPLDGRFRLRFDGVVHSLTTRTTSDNGLVGVVDGVSATSRDNILRCRPAERRDVLRVRVLGPDNRPVRGIVVTIATPAATYGPIVSDSDGVAEFANLPVRRTAVFVGRRTGPARPDLTIDDGDAVDHEVLLGSTRDLRATVSSPAGERIANAAVSVVDVSEATPHLVASVRTDADGRALLRLPPDVSARLEVRAQTDGASGERAASVPVTPDALAVEIVLVR